MSLISVALVVLSLAAPVAPPVDPDEIQPQDVGILANALPCVPGGPTQGDAAVAAQLNPQLANKMRGHMNAYNTSCARAVVQAVRGRGLNQRAAAIAIATVIVETSIANLDGGDLDSVGLFQQRASWGSFQQRTNPVWATNKFLDVMQSFYPNGSWNTAPIGEVAADVQRPAAQYRYRYAVEANDAVGIARRIWVGADRSDVNGDARDDLVTLQAGELKWWASYGTGAALSSNWAAGTQMTTADVNGDGRDDLVTLQGGVLTWWAGFGPGHILSRDWAEGTQITAGDVNGDGRDDLVTLQGGVLTWWAGFGPGHILSRDWADGTQMTTADVNGDGRDDLVTLQGGVLTWWAGFGPGHTLSRDWAEGTQITAGDVNGDGRDDLVTLQGGVLTWWAGFGPGYILSRGWLPDTSLAS